jgi:hypothetical protein
LDRRLDWIMAAVPIGEPGRKLRKRIAANRGHSFVFVTNRSVPYTNNVSERNFRPPHRPVHPTAIRTGVGNYLPQSNVGGSLEFKQSRRPFPCYDASRFSRQESTVKRTSVFQRM